MWRGRGESWVAVQILLLGIIFFLPRLLPEAWGTLAQIATVVGFVISGLGLLIILAAAVFLGSNLTIFPKPIENGRMVAQGIYGIVRHPMYGGVFLAGFGYALANNSLLGLGVALLLGFFFDRKAAREEIWLAEKYPDYAEYKRRVKKLIPFLY